LIVEVEGRVQVGVSESKPVRGYDLATGSLVWERDGLSAENVAFSPVASHGLVFTGSAYHRPGVLAKRHF
jgi:hypothetical protein